MAQIVLTHVFFFLPERSSGVHRGDPYGVPLCTYEHPNGVLIPDPVGVRYQALRGLVSGFSFSIARSAFVLPATLPPLRGGITPLRGVITRRLMRAYSCTYVLSVRKVYVKGAYTNTRAYNFGQFSRDLGQN